MSKKKIRSLGLKLLKVKQLVRNLTAAGLFIIIRDFYFCLQVSKMRTDEMILDTLFILSSVPSTQLSKTRSIFPLFDASTLGAPQKLVLCHPLVSLVCWRGVVYFFVSFGKQHLVSSCLSAWLCIGFLLGVTMPNPLNLKERRKLGILGTRWLNPTLRSRIFSSYSIRRRVHYIFFFLSSCFF